MTNSVSWPGYNQRSHTFELHPIRTTFNKVGGVYIFCRRAANGKWDALYVGETGNFNQRLNTDLPSHQAWPPSARAGCTHVCVKVVNGLGAARTRLNIETEL